MSKFSGVANIYTNQKSVGGNVIHCWPLAVPQKGKNSKESQSKESKESKDNEDKDADDTQLFVQVFLFCNCV